MLLIVAELVPVSPAARVPPTIEYAEVMVLISTMFGVPTTGVWLPRTTGLTLPLALMPSVLSWL